MNERAQALALSSLLCLGRRTITGLLATCGQTFEDWSAAFRLFSRDRFDTSALFRGIQAQVLTSLPVDAPLCVALDDTLLRKRGRKIPGTAWRRDPLGPPFQTNLVWGQRFLQLSAALPSQSPLQTPRMIPISAVHAPTPPKPRANATEEQKKEFREKSRNSSLGTVAAKQIRDLAARVHQSSSKRRVHVLVDGGYTNKTVLRDLPEGLTLIGRIRKDAKLYWLPQDSEQQSLGRRRRYGLAAPTPEELRTDEKIAWRTVSITATGKRHECRIKTIGPVLWRTAGVDRLLRVVVIAPLAYRKNSAGKILYREPAFLICTDPDLPLEQIVQEYFWRWGIEVNFREEKTLLGVGEAQVRDAASCQNVPAMIIAAYAILLLAAIRCGDNSSGLPLPKWRKAESVQRTSTQRLVHQLRAEVWGRSLGLGSHFSDFANAIQSRANPKKFAPQLPSALLYCNS